MADFGREQAKRSNAGSKRYANSHMELQGDNKTADIEENNVSKPVAQEGKGSYNNVRSREELQRAAEDIKSQIGNFAVNPSKWSGKIVVDNSLADKGILGEKRWSCDIALNDTVDDGTIWHEMLHSCSASYYDKFVYDVHKKIEEASVEFLSQQICTKENIISIQSYNHLVNRLRVLNEKFEYGTNLEFAKELFNVPLPDRYQWLENKVDESLRKMNVSFADYYDVLDFVKKLKGGDHE